MGDKAVLWVGEAFLKAGRRPIPEGSNPPQRDAFATSTDYESFRKGLNFQYGFADVQDEEFDAALDAVCHLSPKPSPRKKCNLAAISTWSAFRLDVMAAASCLYEKVVGSISNYWSWSFLWQMVHEKEVVALPAIDPNPGAFARIFPAETTWPADSVEASLDLPTELGDKPMQELQGEARTYVQGLKLGRKKIDGLIHLNIEEVTSEGDQVPEERDPFRAPLPSNIGVEIDDLNRWVSEQSPQIVHRGLTIQLGRIAHSGVLPSRYDVDPVDDDHETLQKRLAVRRRQIQTLVSEGRTRRRDSVFSEGRGIRYPTEYETRIVSALLARVGSQAASQSGRLLLGLHAVQQWLFAAAYGPSHRHP